jgi:small subunit ribosomal protein S20
MANTKSAKKQILINERNNDMNRHYRTAMRTAVKKYLAVLDETTVAAEAKAALTEAQKVINRTVTKGAIKKQTSARKISRLYKHYNEKFAQPAVKA